VKPFAPLTLYIAMPETSAEMQRASKYREHKVPLRSFPDRYQDVFRRSSATEALNAHLSAHGCER